jgi:signal transduction histidine kinase/ActR/RegA family two-component response regulator
MMPTPQGGRVLVAEDDVDVNAALCKVLEKRGYQAIGLTSSADALAALRTQDFDVLLADLEMPEIDGLSLVQAGQESQPHLVSIIMTEPDTVRRALDALQLGAFDYVLKPVQWDVLLLSLSRAMSVRRLRVETAELRERVGVYEIGSAVASTFDVNAIVSTMAAAALRQSEADEVCILLPAGPNALEVAGACGGGPPHAAQVPIAETAAGWVMQNREPLILDRHVQDARFGAWELSDAGVVVLLPMQVGAKVVGVLSVAAEKCSRLTTPRAVNALRVLAGVTAAAIEAAHLYTQATAERKRVEEEIRTRVSQQVAVAELGRRALACRDLTTLLDDAVALVGRTLHVEYAKVLELLPGGNAFLLRAGVGWKAGWVGRATVGAGTDSQAGYTLRSGGAVIVEDLHAETRFRAPPLLSEHQVTSGLSVIIHGRDAPFGVLGAHTTSQRTFGEDDVHFLEAVANVLAAALERRQAEQTLNADLEQRVIERTAQLEAANKELEAFSYSVSHDLRAPLRAIDGFSKALLEDYRDALDTRGLHYLERVQRGAERMGQLIDDLLGLSRVARGEMHRESVDLSALVQSLALELGRTHPNREVQLIVAPGVVADGDARLLRVAFENLLGNAWKYTAKHPQARIEFGVAEGGGQRVYFVRDDGAGFDPTLADRLFRAFQRLHDRDEFEGTGVGLATVQRIIHRHGGRIWAEAAVEQGATFYFTLGPGHTPG